MNEEVKFKNDKFNYYNRAIGVIKNKNQYLILNVDDAPYYHIPGGHIEINEDSLSAVKREINEELNYTVKDATLFCIQENFYEKKGVIQHGVEFYYLVEVNEEIVNEEKIIFENDRGQEKKIVTKWIDSEELKTVDLRPETVKNLMIDNKTDKLTHIIQRD